MKVQKTPNGWTKQARKNTFVISHKLNGQSAWVSSCSNMEISQNTGFKKASSAIFLLVKILLQFNRIYTVIAYRF